MVVDLSGKTALITGGSGGLGRRIAKNLSSCGADVIVTYYNDKESAFSLVEEIKKEGKGAYAVYCDIRNEESVNKMRDEISANFKMPDILCVNAVVQYKWFDILEQDPKDYYSQFESCVMQLVYISKAFAPHLKEQKYGRIVVTNTECTMLCEKGTSAYVAGKRGLDGVAKILAKELGEYNITVNQVAPGWVIHDKERKDGGYESTDYIKEVPLGHRGEDIDIANAVTFLASDYARFITGAFLPVCGGRAMNII